MPIIIGDSGNNTIDGGSGTDIIFGLEGDDILTGKLGNDILVGGPGADGLDGSGGIDAASYEDATSGVIADFLFPFLNTGDAIGDRNSNSSVENLIGSDFDDGLGGNDLANLINGGLGNDTLGGRGGNDQLFGGAGDDRLSGDAGADQLSGGIGIDIADYSAASDGVAVDLETGGSFGEASGDVYDGIEVVIGSNFGDNLLGDALANSLFGLEGDDFIQGRGGNDQLFGAGGADVLFGGNDADTLFGSAGDDALQGEEGNDELFGGDGNDVLVGGGGTNLMHGEAGDDFYFVDNAGDVADETFAGSSGIDTLSASISFRLANPLAVLGEIENLVLTGIANLNGIGNGLDNEITGNGGDNILRGGLGDDTLSGDIGADTLAGGGGLDRLIGGGGNDRLTGGAGRDILNGGGGQDVFDYNALAESGVTDATRDAIVGFTTALAAERIDVSTIDAKALVGGNQAFVFSGSGAFTGAGQIRTTDLGTSTLLRFNTDGDAAAEMTIVLSGLANPALLTAGDFIL